LNAEGELPETGNSCPQPKMAGSGFHGAGVRRLILRVSAEPEKQFFFLSLSLLLKNPGNRIKKVRVLSRVRVSDNSH